MGRILISPWVFCGDFNTTRFPSEKKKGVGITKAMPDFYNFKGEVEIRNLKAQNQSFGDEMAMEIRFRRRTSI